MTFHKKFLLKNFNKIIAVVLIVMMMVPAFSVLSFAENTTRRVEVITTSRYYTSDRSATHTSSATEKPTETQSQVSPTVYRQESGSAYLVDVKLISSVDETGGTAYIPNSNIKIYKVASQGNLKKNFIRPENTYAVAKTGEKGEVDIRLSAGYYIIVEEDFTYNNVKYKAEPMYIEITAKTTSATYYLKHTVVQSRTPIPFTGSTSSAVISCFVAIAAAGAAIVLTKRKKEDIG